MAFLLVVQLVTTPAGGALIKWRTTYIAIIFTCEDAAVFVQSMSLERGEAHSIAVAVLAILIARSACALCLVKKHARYTLIALGEVVGAGVAILPLAKHATTVNLELETSHALPAEAPHAADPAIRQRAVDAVAIVWSNLLAWAAFARWTMSVGTLNAIFVQELLRLELEVRGTRGAEVRVRVARLATVREAHFAQSFVEVEMEALEARITGRSIVGTRLAIRRVAGDAFAVLQIETVKAQVASAQVQLARVATPHLTQSTCASNYVESGTMPARVASVDIVFASPAIPT